LSTPLSGSSAAKPSTEAAHRKRQAVTSAFYSIKAAAIYSRQWLIHILKAARFKAPSQEDLALACEQK